MSIRPKWTQIQNPSWIFAEIDNVILKLICKCKDYHRNSGAFSLTVSPPTRSSESLHSEDRWGKGMHLTQSDPMSYISFLSLPEGDLVRQPHPAVQVTRKYNLSLGSCWPMTRITKYKYLVDCQHPQLTLPFFLSPRRLTPSF